MSGWLALHGGGEFQRGSEIGDRRLIVAAGGADARVIIIPTAAGMEYPDMAARNGINWFKQLGARPDAALAIDVQSANDAQVVAKMESATLIYLPGGDPLFLVNTLRGSKAWTAIVAAHKRGVALGGASAGAMAFGTKMWNPRTGNLIDGLGLIPIVTLPHFGVERIDQARQLRHQLDPAERGIRTTRLFGIAERTSAIWDGSHWNVWGPGAVIEVLADDVKTYQSGESFS
jgi:cyanophycinase